MGMYQPEIETMDRNELEKLQLERLQKQVKNVYENVPMYRERMDKKGVKTEDIKELKDLAKLPFTTKQDLRDYYPFDLFAADKKDIVRIHASSGTTGRQIVAGYTRNDLDMWADCMARQIAAAGGDENSVVQVSYGYGLFTGGLGAHGGSERIGAVMCSSTVCVCFLITYKNIERLFILRYCEYAFLNIIYSLCFFFIY